VLIRFEATNFRSILDPVELSMVAVDRDRAEARPVANLGGSLLPVAAVFGPNASGKSTVIAALTWIRDAVADSLRCWDDGIPVEPCAFADGPDRPSEFTVESVIAGVRFEYVVELDPEAVRYEGLFHYPEKKRRRIFERNGVELTLQRGLGNLSGTRRLLTNRTLALSIARRFDEPLVAHFATHLLAIQTLRQHALSCPAVIGSTQRWFEEPTGSGQSASADSADRAKALALLRLVDLTIEDVVVDEQDVVDPEHRHPRTQRRVRLVRRTAQGRVPFDFASESAGTRRWFQLIGPMLTALRAGSVLLFDELDASLHPTLSRQLIRLFHDPATNPAGAQLIFTSHDTSLLNHLNRDEIWLTEKAADGATRLVALAEFAGERVRRSQNLENAYLHGRFGALPDIDRTDLLRTSG
jgi:predicted ATPase